jgi:hypothetical protein
MYLGISFLVLEGAILRRVNQTSIIQTKSKRLIDFAWPLCHVAKLIMIYQPPWYIQPPRAGTAHVYRAQRSRLGLFGFSLIWIIPTIPKVQSGDSVRWWNIPSKRGRCLLNNHLQPRTEEDAESVEAVSRDELPTSGGKPHYRTSAF